MERTRKPKTEPPDRLENKVCLSQAMLDKLFSQSNPGDVLALYTFYRYTANWQNTDQPKAVDKYCMKGLGWGKIKFAHAKNILIDLNLIEKVPSRNVDGHITHWYIKVNYVWRDTNNNNTEISVVVHNRQVANVTATQTAINGVDQQQVLKTTCCKQETNALKSINKNTLKIKSIDIEKNSYELFLKYFPQEWLDNQLFKSTIKKLVTHYKEKKKLLTQTSISLLAEEIIKLGSSQIAIESINKTIINNWSGFFPVKTIKSVKSEKQVKNPCPYNWKFGIDHNKHEDCQYCDKNDFKSCKSQPKIIVDNTKAEKQVTGVCLNHAVFGKDFKPDIGRCRECEEETNLTWKKCRYAFENLINK